MINLTLPFLSGLSGGFSHCIGMCGIFVLTVASVSSEELAAKHYGTALTRQLLFHVGRLVSLTLLGVVAGAIGSLAGFREHVPAVQAWMGLIAGTLLAVLSLGQLGIIPALRIPEPDVLGANGGKGRQLYVRVLRANHWLKPLALGLLVGVLPCGLTYYILIYALAAGSVLDSAACMAAFGSGTIPGLLALGMLASSAPSFLASRGLRVGMTRLSGIILLIMAGFLIHRGWETLNGL
ncbi:MAG TPA: sulfite exporter TauE/SafE family protein [Capsulimonadaceae bacterium]|jgi:hypothetical protein